MKFRLRFLALVIIAFLLSAGYLYRHKLYNYFKDFKNKGRLLFYDNGWKSIPDKYYSLKDFNGQKPFLMNSLITVKKGRYFKIRLLKLRREGGLAPFRVYLFSFDPQYFDFKVHVNTKRNFIKKFFYNDMLFGVNASFFDARGRIIGLVVSNGRRITGAESKKRAYFMVLRNRKQPVIFSSNLEKTRLKIVQEAVRGYPLIMNNGIVHPGVFNNTKRNSRISRRTVVGKLLNGNICFLLTDTIIAGLSLKELPIVLGGLGSRDALNLDGGGSTQALFSHKGFNIEINGKEKIPVVIGVYPKKDI